MGARPKGLRRCGTKIPHAARVVLVAHPERHPVEAELPSRISRPRGGSAATGDAGAHTDSTVSVNHGKAPVQTGLQGPLELMTGVWVDGIDDGRL